MRLVEEALASGVQLQGAVVSPALEATERGRSLAAALRAAGHAVEQVDDAELAKLADTEQPQGVVAVVEPRRWTLEDIASGPGSVVLVLDGVQDPGNVGTMLRTALGLGASGVIALPGTVELTNTKVLRGSMGAVFRLPSVATGPDSLTEWVAVRGAALWVADAAGDPLRGRPGSVPVALVVGNEGAGVSATLAAAAQHRVAIPLAPGAESLNVSVAAAILLHELLRGR